jgi:hypothetical protein
MLCEIIGKDTVLEAYSTGNINLIINSLASIDGDRVQATKLISFIDNISYTTYTKSNLTYADYEDSINKIIELLNKYNSAKNSKDLNEDQILNAYCMQLKLENDVTVVKGYFSNSYIEGIGNPYIEEKKETTEMVYDDATNNLMEITVIYTNKTLLDQQETLAYQKTKY